ncbi:MAG TPA: hypothetical protein ENN90_04750 [Mariniphaga anaerophila]|uniref:MG2 domain-containing protein n=1 Tax=Mariniphaga anaerophila TaxID=1484053 RepID=A0A831PL60_9BACT|nr:hypothetical protein [Mariniphaga anaerophila]
MNMKVRNQILGLLFSVLFFSGHAQTGKTESGLYLFTDRDFCVSGDTVWFKVVLNGESKSNVVHVQLADAGNHTIASVIKKCTGKWAEGFIHIPDSLSSGVCFLSAFLYEHLSETGRQVEKKSLFVYNRFQRDLPELLIPAQEDKREEITLEQQISINPDKKTYKVREQVAVEIGLGAIHPEEVAQVVVKASLVDELARQAGGRFLARSAASHMVIPHFQEKDGFILSGKVTKANSDESPEKAVVFLSLPENPRYLDYYVTGNDGYFHFFLQNAVGVGEAVLQAISEDETELQAKIEFSIQKIQQPVSMQKQTLTQPQIDFKNALADAGFIKRLFQEEYTIPEHEFSMPERFTIPAYGYPQRAVNLDEYYELNDFREISRELLGGVRFRTRDGTSTIRMLNWNENAYFDSEPFRLVNGIPVFKNRLFASFGSADIDRVEYTMEDRLFGDLRFPGILALYLKESSNRWLVHQPNFTLLTVPLMQPQHTPEFLSQTASQKNLPDLRSVFFWQLIETGSDQKIDFPLSDLKGKVEITVEGIASDGQIFKCSEIIEVK